MQVYHIGVNIQFYKWYILLSILQTQSKTICSGNGELNPITQLRIGQVFLYSFGTNFTVLLNISVLGTLFKISGDMKNIQNMGYFEV